MTVRGSLAQRISLLAVAVAVITGVVAGVLSLSLTRTVSESGARRQLKQLAELAARQPNATTAKLGRRITVLAPTVQKAELDPAGTIVRGGPLAVDATNAFTAAQKRKLLSTGSLSLRTTVDGTSVFVEARTTGNGAIVLLQRRADALAVADEAIRRVVIALLVGVGVAVVLGLLVAYRIARPLRRTAQAAHALADGHRDVRVSLAGPAEVAEVGAAVNTLAGALSASEARQRDFLLSVSHDLRTPLTAITGFAESLAEDVVPAEQTAHVGAVMLAEAQRLNRMVGDLLDLARLDARDFRVDIVPTDLGALARDTGQVWSTRCAGEGVRFLLQLPDHPLVVPTDPLRVRQILDGLLENALRVTPGRCAHRARAVYCRRGCGPGRGEGRPRGSRRRSRADRRRPGGGVPAVGALRAVSGCAQGRHRPGAGHRRSVVGPARWNRRGRARARRRRPVHRPSPDLKARRRSPDALVAARERAAGPKNYGPPMTNRRSPLIRGPAIRRRPGSACAATRPSGWTDRTV